MSNIHSQFNMVKTELLITSTNFRILQNRKIIMFNFWFSFFHLRKVRHQEVVTLINYSENRSKAGDREGIALTS